jgi:hypothetical protein
LNLSRTRARYPSSLLGCLAIFLNRGIAISVCRAHIADVLKGKKGSRVRISKGKGLQDSVKELEEKPANSVPKTELETVRSSLESKIAELERTLCESAPKTRLEVARKDLQAKITDLETKLRDSIPRSEGEAG